MEKGTSIRALIYRLTSSFPKSGLFVWRPRCAGLRRRFQLPAPGFRLL